MVTLHLNVHGKFFDQIYAGIKKEEYRAITEFWAKRFLVRYPFIVGEKTHCHLWAWSEITMGDWKLPRWKGFTGNAPSFKPFDTITFSNGYAKDRRQLVIDFKGFSLGPGRVEWGAVYKEDYFILHLGKIISTKNINN